MESIGLAVALLIAVGSWIVNGVLARRSARRDLRVEYLLSAYRALDSASNRETMTPEQARELEEAIGDVFLLGDDRQVKLAGVFSEQFAADGDADLKELLEDLRADLRRELQLGDAGARTTWLRIRAGTPG